MAVQRTPKISETDKTFLQKPPESHPSTPYRSAPTPPRFRGSILSKSTLTL